MATTTTTSDAEYFSHRDHHGSVGGVGGYGGGTVSRFPVHDACEFHDAEFLRRLIFVRRTKNNHRDDSSSSEDSDSDSSSSDGDGDGDGDDDVSDSDDSSSSGGGGGVNGHGGSGDRGGDGGTCNDDESSGTDGEHDNAAAAAAVTGYPQREMSASITAAAASAAAASASITAAASAEHNNGSSHAETPMETQKEQEEGTKEEEALDNDTKMEIDDPENSENNNKITGTTSTPERQENDNATTAAAAAAAAASVENISISPVKLNSRITEEATPNAELLEKLGVNIGNNNKADSTATATKTAATATTTATTTSAAAVSDTKSTPKKKNKKERKEKIDRGESFYCPHNLDLRDNDENTPLHVAIHNRKIQHMKLLLEAGASCHRKSDGSAPIHTVISIGAITAHKGFAYEAAVLLQKYGVDFTMRDDAAHTPLYLAAVCNVPSIAGLILNDAEGKQTLNLRSDRSGGRPLHAAAKFDVSKINKMAPNINRPANGHGINASLTESIAAVTQIFLNTEGIEVNAKNNFGRTPLHVAAGVGNWQVVRLLLKSGADPSLVDQRGFTPGGLAYKRGMPVPNDLQSVLGPMNSGIPSSLDSSSFMPAKRDLIIDPVQPTFLICHELCSNHFTCSPITRDPELDIPPENVRRLTVLLDQSTGILRGGEFDGCKWESECRRASMADILKIHDYSYIENINRLCNMIPDVPNGIAHLDGDTAISRWSFEAALRAAGSVCDAVDRIMAGDFRNAFCAVRPPGHHAGPRGIVRCANDTEGSHGFCLLNNVAIGAAYARSMYRNDGIKKVAIVDFDVHHGNGTEEIIRQLSPNIEKASVRMSFASGTFETPRYKPWLDETDIDNVFFASAHGYGPRCRSDSDFEEFDPQINGWFYPASGKSYISESFRSPVETPDQNEFILSQTWTRMGEEMRMNCCKIINVGLSLPKPSDIPGMQRVDVRDSYRKQILPNLLQFDPDIIFISAGFDGHKKDTMNYGYVGMVEEDYEWLTEQLVKVANTCCNGRIVSVLEGGYKIHGGIVSPFARSVASHVRALVEGGNSRELYDKFEAEWESTFERGMVEDRERKRQQRMERLNRAYAGVTTERRRELNFLPTEGMVSLPTNPATYDMDAILKEPLSQNMLVEGSQDTQETQSESIDGDQPRKRKRNAVDYKELYEQLRKEEGVA